MERLTGVWETWQGELTTLVEQIAVLDSRQLVLQELADTVTSKLSGTQDLQRRGLQTATQLASVRIQDADARDDLFELESRRLTAQASLAQTRQKRAEFLTQRRADLTAEREAALAARAVAQLSYDRIQSQLAQLQFVPGGAQGGSGLDVVYEIQTMRLNRLSGETPNKATPLLPGDTLIVSLRFGGSRDALAGN